MLYRRERKSYKSATLKTSTTCATGPHLNLKQSFFFFLIGIIGFSVQADVWKSKGNWGEEEEKSYRLWISQRGFNKTVFTDPKSPYAGIPTDCADVIYASRIIFAFENKILFKVRNPDPNSNIFTRYVSNRTNKFDNYEEGVERVKAFITYIGKMSGTNKLSEVDSYPVAIEDLKPGDFYITQQKLNSGTLIRHAYLIQNVYPTGVFDLIYSTLPYKVRELKKHRGLPLFSFKGKPFGFKRFKPSYLRNRPEEEWPGHSDEQYVLLKKVGENSILSQISRMFKTEEEGLQGRASRLVQNICMGLNDRIEAIDDARRFVERVKRCVTKPEFHNYSTPVKDERISKQIEQLRKFWKAVHQQNRFAEFREDFILGVNDLFSYGEASEEEQKKLCSDFPLIPITIKSFRRLYKEEKISSHPNDSVAARWGQAEHQNNCQRFY